MAATTNRTIPSLAAASVLAALTFAGASALGSSGGPTGAAATYTSTSPTTLRVTGAGTTVTDVDVVLTGLSGTDPAEPDLVLVAPDGRQAVVPTGAHDSPDPLAAFDGTNPNGTWRLRGADRTDDLDRGRGGRQRWSLRLTTVTLGDTVHPRVTSSSPAAQSEDATAPRLRVTLSEAVRPGTVAASSVRVTSAGSGARVAASVTWHADTRSLVVQPLQGLEPRTTYRVVVSPALRDHAGNALDQDPTRAGSQPASWTFTTR